MDSSSLSPTMKAAVRFAKQHGGKLTRYPGGYWSCEGFYSTLGGGGSKPYFGTSTIEALVARDIGLYTAWQDGRAGRFPVEMTLIQWERAQQPPREAA